MENMENNQTQIEEQEITEKTGQNKEKMFTQEEVNEIVQKRLNRERNKNGTDPEGNQLSDRENELLNREKALLERETLMERGMPKELSGMIQFTDEKDLNSKLDILETLINNDKEQPKVETRGFRQIGVGRDSGNNKSDPLRNAFGLK